MSCGKAIVNRDTKRLYKEAREYLALRSKRKKFVAQQKAENLIEAGGRPHHKYDPDAVQNAHPDSRCYPSATFWGTLRLALV